MVVLDQAVGDGPARGSLFFGSGHQAGDGVLELLDVVVEPGDFGHGVGLPSLAGVDLAFRPHGALFGGCSAVPPARRVLGIPAALSRRFGRGGDRGWPGPLRCHCRRRRLWPGRLWPCALVEARCEPRRWLGRSPAVAPLRMRLGRCRFVLWPGRPSRLASPRAAAGACSSPVVAGLAVRYRWPRWGCAGGPVPAQVLDGLGQIVGDGPYVGGLAGPGHGHVGEFPAAAVGEEVGPLGGRPLARDGRWWRSRSRGGPPPGLFAAQVDVLAVVGPQGQRLLGQIDGGDDGSLGGDQPARRRRGRG